MSMRYYLIGEEGALAAVVPEDASEPMRQLGERLRSGKSKKEMINGRKYVRAFGVITGGKH